MKKFINFRPFFILFLICICCVYCSVKVSISLFYLFIFILPITFFIYLIIKRKLVFLSISIAVVLFVSCYSYFFVKNFKDEKVNNSYFVVMGEVNNINKVNSNFYYLTIANAKGIDEVGNKKDFNGSISVGLYDYNQSFNIKIQDKIMFETYLTSTNFYNESGSINSFYIKYNIRYLAKNMNINSVVTYESQQDLLVKFKSYNRSLLVESFGDEVGELAYAVLYGDKTFVADNLLDVFKSSGVVHLFAVSGLHVGLIVALLYFILKKLKASDLVNFIVSCMFLFIFCLVCSFTPSVVRASIMSLTILFSKLVFRKNDILSSLSFAGVVLISLNPLTIFDAGFQMSFLAVFGLITLGNLVRKMKIKNSGVKGLVYLILITLSVEIALVPILTKIYGFLPTWGLIANIISIPVFSIFYPILFVTNLLVLILPFLSFIYFVPKALLYFIVYINKLVLYLPFSAITIRSSGLIIATIYYFTQFFVSDYNLTRKKFKIIFGGALLVCVVVLIFLTNLQ